MTFTIRLAQVDDAFGIAKVHVDVWRSTYRGIMPDKVLDELTYQQRAKTRKEHLEKNDPRYCCYVAEDENKNVIGFAMGGPLREGNINYDGELYAIYLFKEFHGKGIGKGLFLQVAGWLREKNFRSMLIWVLKDNPTRKFYESMGGKELESKIIEIGAPLVEVSYGWSDLSALSYEQPELKTTRLVLEPITELHAEELWKFFSDTELHHFVPFEPPTLAQQIERCVRWAKRRSPDGKELWLNWAARDKKSEKIVAHIQAGVKDDKIASIGYVVSRDFQRSGIATECLEVVFEYLRDSLEVKEVKAWSDTRNEASHRLVEKLGMVKIETIKDADFFKGKSSDEFVFSKIFKT